MCVLCFERWSVFVFPSRAQHLFFFFVSNLFLLLLLLFFFAGEAAERPSDQGLHAELEAQQRHRLRVRDRGV